MTRWEYKIIQQTLTVEGNLFNKTESWEPEVDLNDLGVKGWELVNVVPIGVANGNATPTQELQLYFKRPA